MRELIVQLDSVRERPCVSLFVPLVPGSARADDNTMRLKSALHAVEGKLLSYGLSAKGESQLLADARSFAEEDLKEQTGGGTIALFLAPSCFHHALLPGETERTVIAQNFFLLPLVESIIVSQGTHGDAMLDEADEGGQPLVHEIGDIIRMAEAGELRALLCAEGAEEWGVRDAESGILALHASQEEGDREWIGHSAACVLQSGGNIGFLSRDRIMGGAGMVGIALHPPS